MLLAYICVCLNVSENGSLFCNISSFYAIYLSKSLLKSVTPKEKEGGANWRGGAKWKKYGNQNVK